MKIMRLAGIALVLFSVAGCEWFLNAMLFPDYASFLDEGKVFVGVDEVTGLDGGGHYASFWIVEIAPHEMGASYLELAGMTHTERATLLSTYVTGSVSNPPGVPLSEDAFYAGVGAPISSGAKVDIGPLATDAVADGLKVSDGVKITLNGGMYAMYYFFTFSGGGDRRGVLPLIVDGDAPQTLNYDDL